METGSDVVDADAGEDRDTIPPAIAVVCRLVAKLSEAIGREVLVGELGLLHREDVGLAGP